MDNSKLAFPKVTPDGDFNQNGLTKREYIAALVVAAIYSNPDSMKIIADYHGPRNNEVYGYVSRQAIDQADSLLKELEL